VVVIKAGTTKEGAKAASSHTGAMAGDSRVFAGAFEQSGMVVVDDLEEMLDVLKLFAMQPLPGGGNIGMTTNGVGPCVVAIDFLSKYANLKLAPLNRNALTGLKLRLPPFCVFDNPLDLTGSADASMYGIALDFLAEEPAVDILMPFFVYQDAPLAATVDLMHKIMVDAKRHGKTLLGVASGADFTRRESLALQKDGVPMIPTPRRAIAALSKVLRYAEWRKQHP
jgi:3-hydroxypropionyl-CoA synthetase (ADP-forming)